MGLAGRRNLRPAQWWPESAHHNPKVGNYIHGYTSRRLHHLGAGLCAPWNQVGDAAFWRRRINGLLFVIAGSLAEVDECPNAIRHDISIVEREVSHVIGRKTSQVLVTFAVVLALGRE